MAKGLKSHSTIWGGGGGGGGRGAAVQFFRWEDKNTLRLFHTSIRLHLEYVCQIWNTLTKKNSGI